MNSTASDSGFSRENFAMSRFFFNISGFLQVLSFKQDCLKWPLFWQKLENFWLPSPDLEVANLPTYSVKFSTMFFSLSSLSESVFADVATKGTVVFIPILHNRVSTLDFISSSKLSNLVLPLNCKIFRVSL